MSLIYSPVPNFFCGPHPLRPGRENFNALLQEGVNYFLDLTGSGELPEYTPAEYQVGDFLEESPPINCPPLPIHHSRFPIPDYSTPTRSHMTAILDALDAALTAGHTIYLHCHGGRGRTGTVVGCWLVRHGMTGEQALVRIAELRGDHESPETDEQRAFVLYWDETSQKEIL